MDFTTIINTIFLSYGAVFLNFALAILVIREKQRVHYLGAALLATYGVMCIAGVVWGACSGVGNLVNLALLTPMLSLATIASFLIHECFGDFDKLWKMRLFTVIGTIAVWIALLVIAAMGLSWDLGFSFVFGWLAVVFLIVSTYEGLTLKPLRNMSSGLFWFYCAVSGDSLVIVLIFVFLLLKWLAAVYVLCVFLILSVLAVTLLAFRAPETYRLIGFEIEKIRHPRHGPDPSFVEEACRRLDVVMRKERLFLDPELTLDYVAAKISVRRNQLSEIINLHLGQNFTAYVNSFRLEHARELLSSSHDVSILEIALDCGFNSKSVFNSLFRKSTGLTPSEYRRLNPVAPQSDAEIANSKK